MAHRATMARTNLLILLTAALLAGCVGAPEIRPDFIDPAFSADSINQIIVLPAVDLRYDRSESADDIQELMITPSGLGRSKLSAESLLADKGYSVDIASYLGVGNISKADLLELDPNWVKELGPNYGRWIMLVALDKLVDNASFGASWTAECTGYMFDKDNAKLIWRHKGRGEMSAGGLIAMMLDDLVRQDALVFCSRTLFQQVPNKIE